MDLCPRAVNTGQFPCASQTIQEIIGSIHSRMKCQRTHFLLIKTMKTENKTVTLAGIELLPAEIRTAIDDGREWLAKGRMLHFVSHSENAGFSARPVYKERGSLPLVARGRFRLMTAREANSLVGFELCIATEGGAN